jgi:hypothetical protein
MENEFVGNRTPYLFQCLYTINECGEKPCSTSACILLRPWIRAQWLTTFRGMPGRLSDLLHLADERNEQADAMLCTLQTNTR